MPKTFALNPSQAQAVYSAMAALNNVGANLSAYFEGMHVASDEDGVEIRVGLRVTERYSSQAAFADAYSLA